MTDTDVVVLGAGLAGLVATAELTAAGHRVVLLDAEPPASLGGQAWWYFGGLFLVDSPEQRRLGIKDSAELALADWLGSADFAAGDDDHFSRAWAEGFVDFAAGELRPWLHAQGVRWFPLVHGAERGGYLADGHGNSVPRFHVTWGTGPGLLEPFVRTLLSAHRRGLVDVRFRHRATELATTDGRVTGVRGAVVHSDRMWHYPEGITNHSLRHITRRGDDHSWFVLDKTILGAELALSGSEQNPDLTGKDVPLLLQRALPGAVGPVEAFAADSPEFLWADTPGELAARMNTLAGSDRIDAARLTRTIELRDAQVATGLGKDLQVVATAMARRYVVDRLIRVAPPHELLDPRHGPLLAIRLSVLTRKTLGGLLTDTDARVLRPDRSVLTGLYAVGEAGGFGGGVHGHRALEGTFLGGCLFSGRTAGRALAADLRA
jgi:predicted oxidoreductase